MSDDIHYRSSNIIRESFEHLLGLLVLLHYLFNAYNLFPLTSIFPGDPLDLPRTHQLISHELFLDLPFLLDLRLYVKDLVRPGEVQRLDERRRRLLKGGRAGDGVVG